MRIGDSYRFPQPVGLHWEQLSGGAMQLSKVFSEQYIRVGLKSKNKHDLFEELVHALEEREDIDVDDVLRTLWSREEMLNTRIAPGIAIPHTQVKHIQRTMGILGISPGGIDYDVHDGEKIRIVVMLIDDESATIEHLDTLRNFAILAKNPRFVQKVLECQSPREVYDTIVKFESMLR